jgi:hypothetical protein
MSLELGLVARLSGYNAKMIMNRAEAMSCGGCHQNSSNAEIAPNVKWPPSKFFVHVDERYSHYQRVRLYLHYYMKNPTP